MSFVCSLTALKDTTAARRTWRSASANAARRRSTTQLARGASTGCGCSTTMALRADTACVRCENGKLGGCACVYDPVI